MAFDNRLSRIETALAVAENPLVHLAYRMRRAREALANGARPERPDWMNTPEGIAERARALRAAMREARA